MAADRDIGSLLYEIRIPVLVAIVWATVGMVTPSFSGPLADAVWVAVRVALSESLATWLYGPIWSALTKQGARECGML